MWPYGQVILFCVLQMLSNSAAVWQPNIVFIMADDMGWNDVSFHGSDQIQTPNIDTLAYHGVILQHYYSEAVCTPARTALLTGKYPMRLGMHGLPLYNSEDRGIPLTERLLPSYLKDLGYATHLVGKWHVGMSREEYLPTNRGYDTHYGFRGGAIDYYTYNKVETWPNGRLLFGLDLFNGSEPQEQEQRYVVDAFTDRAVEVINNHNTSQPLFLHVTHNAPHAGNDGASLQPPLNGSVKNKHIANSDRRLYADVVTHLDESVGHVVKALASRNMLDNTIIIFASDNGAPTFGMYGNWGSNIPMRGIKFTPWEGAVRVPAFIWHSSFKSNVWNGLMHITDWLPTLATAAGGTLDKKVDGVDQWNSITTGGLSNRNDVLLTINDGNRNMYASYRAGDYKIVVGNVSGLSNNHYSYEFLINKANPPDYYEELKSCEVSKAFKSIGLYKEREELERIRQAAVIENEDTEIDTPLCEPSPTRGCLFNIVKDPLENHDLWNELPKIANLLINKLENLWVAKRNRGLSLQDAADPAYHNYVWTTWIKSNVDYNYDEDNTNLLRSLNNFALLRNSTSKRQISSQSECDETLGLRRVLCVFRSVFS